MTLHQEFLYADAHIESWETSEKEAIERLRAFQWDRELTAANQLKQCSPTVSVEYPQKKQVLWASVIEKNEDIEFLVSFEDATAPKSNAEQSDDIPLRVLSKLFELFYRGEFESLRKALEKRKSPETSYDKTRKVLTRQWLLFEMSPLVAGLTYSYFYPSRLIPALSVYAVLALINVGRSIKDGQILDKYGIVDSRSKEPIDFWLMVVFHAFFPVLILVCAVWDIIHSKYV